MSQRPRIFICLHNRVLCYTWTTHGDKILAGDISSIVWCDNARYCLRRFQKHVDLIILDFYHLLNND